MTRFAAIREHLRGSLLVMPTAMAAAAVIAGILLSRIPIDRNSPIAFQGTADDARDVLSAITGTMVTVIALLLGLSVVALQLSSTQFSPRLLRNFLRDRTIQGVLGVIVATFAYSAAGLFTVGVDDGQRVDEFPRLAVTVAVGLLFVSLGLLIYFADHLAHSIQVDAIMRMVERETLPIIDRTGGGEHEAVLEPPDDATRLPAPRSGYVQSVDIERLLTAASGYGVHIRVRPLVGEHVVRGTVLAWAWRPDGDAPDRTAALTAAVNRSVRLGFERTLQQDAGFGFRRLVDIACRALSAAINDPYTAIQAIDHLAVLFARLAARPVGDHVRTDRASGVTVTVPGRRFEDYLGISMGLIRRHGAQEPTVAQAQLRLLTSCAAMVLDDSRAEAVRTEAERVVKESERRVADPADLDVVHREADTLRQVLVRRHGPGTGRPPDL